MVTLILVAGAIILVAALVVLGSVFWKYSGDRVITCPENERPAGVKVDAGHASLSVLGGKADLRLKSCSRWPERQDCGQQCLRQIEASPEGCLVRHILTQWYEGKNCAVCGQATRELEDVTDAIIGRSIAAGIDVVYIRDNTPLDQAGNVGALLRFRADQNTPEKLAS